MYDSDVWVDWYVTKLPLLPRNRPTPKMHYSGTAGQRDRCVLGFGSDRSIKKQPLGRFRLLCCGIFVTEVKSLISRFTAFGSLIYCVLEMEATQFIFISNKQLFPLSSQWGLIKTLWTTIFFSNLNDWLNVMFNSSNGGDDDHLYDFNTKWETCSMLFIKNTRSSFVLLEL